MFYVRYMEALIAKWIRETITEMETAKKNQNYYKVKEMQILYHALKAMRDNLLKDGLN